MTHEIVSVIIPVYNVEKYLSKCLDSIINQTYKYLEIILIDDGSTDNSGRICEEYANIDSRVKVIHKKNGGLSDARNVGLDVCLGKYILFVDSDDYVCTSLVESVLTIALQESADIVEFGFKFVNETQYVKWQELNNTYKVYVGQSIIENVLDYKFSIVAWNKLYKANLFKEIRYPVGKIHEDEFTTPYVVEKCNKYVKMKDCYYAYVQREASIMNSRFSSKRFDIFDAYSNRMDYFSKKYNEKYSDVMKYHTYVLISSFLQFDLKDYQKEYTDLIKSKKRLAIELLIYSRISFNKKIKICGYYFLPKILLKYQKK